MYLIIINILISCLFVGVREKGQGAAFVGILIAIPLKRYSISQEICTRFCCALLCCGYAIVHNEFT